MSAKMTVDQLGGDRFVIDIRGHRLVVDQPTDSAHFEAGPTPTELFVAALAGCTAHYAHRVLVREDPEATVRVTARYQMSTGTPNRVELVELEATLPPGLSAPRRASVERAMQHCTVHESLTQPPQIIISIEPETHLDRALAPANADAAVILEHVRRPRG